MDMTQEDREALAARLTRELEVRFRGVAKRAYTAAAVNAATWANAVNARPIKPHSQREIVANLWPETLGEWTKIPDDVDQSDKEPDVMEMLRALQHRVDEQEREIEALRNSETG